ncbi:MAG: hypothetical protein H0T46_06050 [Deltaproteobacteria bacterium]|nr:hypothetical protein [Deltaproteobacteria bacterium]
MLLFCPASVLAGGRGGGHHGGGGALGKVSSGLGSASRGGGGSSSTESREERRREPVYVDAPVPIHANGGVIIRRRQKPLLPPPPAHIEGYVGASKVHDSDGSLSAELGVVDDWFRVDGSYTRYYEAQPGMNTLTLSMPKITGGVRLYDGPGSKIYITAGLVGAKTKHDQVMDSSFVGVTGGVRVVVPSSDLAALVGTAEVMLFEDNVTATSLRAGVRIGPLEATLRLLDFNVGPPLWGPELGLRF